MPIQPNFSNPMQLPEEPKNPEVDPQYVLRRRDDLITEFDGLFQKMSELEKLRHQEDVVQLPAHERPTGIEIRTGMTDDLVEKVKASLTTNDPSVQFHPQREGQKATENASKRSTFWNYFIRWVSHPLPFASEAVDAQVGLGMGILKAVYTPWPDMPKKAGEQSDQDYLEMLDGYKRKYGPPFGIVPTHPICFMPVFGPRNILEEVFEEGYKSKLKVFESFQLDDQKLRDLELHAVSGQPNNRWLSLPQGQSTSTLVKVTEYYNCAKDYRQVYIEDRLVLEEKGSSVAYFPILGRTTSSRDPDKLALSIAEPLRHIEPQIDRTLTRMAEASDMLVRKRLAVEMPESSTDWQTVGEDNNPQPRSFEFNPEKATAIPPGAKIEDPFKGVENIYDALPWIQLLMQISGQHGVSPIIKGVSSGAGASGYKDNSLYLMARSQYDYILNNFQYAMAQLIAHLEYWVVTKAQRKVVCGPYSLSPEDITEFPAEITVEVKPFLPQNIQVEGEFYDLMWGKGHITRRRLLQDGIQVEDPIREERERMEEDVWGMMKPVLYQDVLRTVGVLPPAQPAQPAVQDTSGKPIAGDNPNIDGGAGGGRPEGGAAQSAAQTREAANTNNGQYREPSQTPGTVQ